jgi:AraC family transcriptional regulator
MRPTATGRILVWRGGSLWIGLAGEPAGEHAHHAVQIALPFPRGWVRFRRPSGSWTSYAAAIVAADESHSFEAREQFVAQIFVEPESREGRSLHLRYRDDGVAALAAETLEHERAALATAYEDGASDAELIARARHAITALAGSTGARPSLPDTRIARGGDYSRAVGELRSAQRDCGRGPSFARSLSPPVRRANRHAVSTLCAMAAA